MCGFSISTRGVSNLGSAIRHRGPDETVFFEDPGLLWGVFHRLAINDLAGGSQPVVSNCRRFVCFFNGELTNWDFIARKVKDVVGVSEEISEARCIVELVSVLGLVDFHNYRACSR